MIPYKIVISGNELFIIYFGSLFEYKYEAVEMYYSFNENWSETKVKKMEKTENGFIARIPVVELTHLNFCFTCEDGSWDSNYGSNYSVNISEIVQSEENYANNNVVQPIQKKEMLKDCGTLLISEVKGKVFLPYKVEEIEAIIEDSSNPYKTARRGDR